MSTSLQIYRTGGSGYVDYSNWIYADLSQQALVTLKHQLNQPRELDFTLQDFTPGFTLPETGNRVKFTTSQFGVTFTGYITSISERESLSSSDGTSANAVYGYQIVARSDDMLLTWRAPAIFPTLPPFVNQTQGQILKNLISLLGASFDTTNVASGVLIPYFRVKPDESFWDAVRRLSDRLNMAFWVVNGYAYYQPYTAAAFPYSVNDSDADAGKFDPTLLDTTEIETQVYNDVVGTGLIEPQGYVHETMVGDGLTATFPLKCTMYGSTSSLLLEDDWTETAPAVPDPNTWLLHDVDNLISMAGGSIRLSGGVSLTNSWLTALQGIELAGKVELSSGRIMFNQPTDALIGAIMLSDSGSISQCVAGFRATQTGSGTTKLQPVVNGAAVGPTYNVLPNRTYELKIFADTPYIQRQQQYYYAQTSGAQYGGQTYPSVTTSLSFEVNELPDDTIDLPTVVLQYATSIANSPAFVFFIAFSGPFSNTATGVLFTLNYTVVSKPPQCELWSNMHWTLVNDDFQHAALNLNMITDPDVLSQSNWTNAGLAFASGIGAVSGNGWLFVGAGKPSGNQYVYTKPITVVPGSIYTVSAYIDARACTSTIGPNLNIFDTGITTAYASVQQTPGQNGRVSATFTVPAGVTQIVVLLDTDNSTINAGASVAWSNPQLEPGSTASAYANWVAVENGGLAVYNSSELYNSSTTAGTRQTSYVNLNNIPDDQYAELVISTTTNPNTDNNGIGPAVRISPTADSYYGYYITGKSRYLFKSVAGVITVLTSIQTNGTGAAVGDILRLEVRGGILTSYLNGAEDLAGNDTDLTSGMVGATSISDGTNDIRAQNWSGGGLVLSPNAAGQWTRWTVGNQTDASARAAIVPANEITNIQFFQYQTPAAGEILKIVYRAAGVARSRIQNTTSITAQAAISGDSGIRAYVLDQVNPQPRNVIEVESAIQAFIADHSGPQYQGSWTFSSKLYGGSTLPVPGCWMTVNTPSRFSNSPFSVFINEVDMNYLLEDTDGTDYIDIIAQIGPLYRLDEEQQKFAPPDDALIGQYDNIIPLQPQYLYQVGSFYSADRPYADFDSSMLEAYSVSDNFDRQSLGSDWATNGPAGLQINASYDVEASVVEPPLYTDNASRWTDTVFPPNQFSRITITAIGANDDIGVIVRADPQGAYTYYYAFANANGVALWKTLDGNDTNIQNDLTFTPAVGDTIELRAVGTTISVFHNGTQIISVTDTDISSGQPGIWAQNDSGTSPSTSRGSYWVAGTLEDAALTSASSFDIDMGAGPDSSYEVRKTDDGWGSGSTINLISTPTGERFSIPRVSRDVTAYIRNVSANTQTDPLTTSLNAAWASVDGAFAIDATSHSLEVSATGADGGALMYWGGVTFDGNQYAEVEVSAVGTVSGNELIGPSVYVSPSAVTHYGFHINPNGNIASLFKEVAGTTTNLTPNVTAQVNVGDILRLEITAGGVLTAKQNGVVLMTATDTSITSGAPGLHGFAVSNFRATNFQCGNLYASSYQGMSRYPSIIRIALPLVPQTPTATLDISDPSAPVISIGIAILSDPDAYGFEIRDKYENTLYNFANLAILPSDLDWTYTNASGDLGLEFHIYTFNLQGEYSNPFILTETIDNLGILGELQGPNLIGNPGFEKNSLTYPSYTASTMAELTDGPNIAVNGDFESSTAIPPYGWSAGSSTTLSYDTTTQQSGTRSLKVVTTVQYGGAHSNLSWPVNTGDTYIISGYLKQSNANEALMQVNFLNSSGTFAGAAQAYSSVTGAWVYAIAVAQVPSGAVTAQIVLQDNLVGGGTIEFDSIYVSKLTSSSTAAVSDGWSSYAGLNLNNGTGWVDAHIFSAGIDSSSGFPRTGNYCGMLLELNDSDVIPNGATAVGHLSYPACGDLSQGASSNVVPKGAALLPCRGGDWYYYGGYARIDQLAAPPSGVTIKAYLQLVFTDANYNVVGGFASDDISTVVNAYTYLDGLAEVPSNASFMFFLCTHEIDNASGSSWTPNSSTAIGARFDDVFLYKAERNTNSTYRPLSNPLTGHDAGSSATINIAAFTMQGGASQVACNSGAITSLSYNTLYYVYYDDPAFAGGAVTYHATTVKETAIFGENRYFVGSVQTPRSGAIDTIGNNDGGSGAQSGLLSILSMATVTPFTFNNGNQSGANNVNDGNATTYGTLTVPCDGLGGTSGNTAQFSMTGPPGISERFQQLNVKVLYNVTQNQSVTSASGGPAILIEVYSAAQGVILSYGVPTGATTLGPTVQEFTITNPNINIASLQVIVTVNTASAVAGNPNIVVNVYEAWIEGIQ